MGFLGNLQPCEVSTANFSLQVRVPVLAQSGYLPAGGREHYRSFMALIVSRLRRRTLRETLPRHVPLYSHDTTKRQNSQDAITRQSSSFWPISTGYRTGRPELLASRLSQRSAHGSKAASSPASRIRSYFPGPGRGCLEKNAGAFRCGKVV